MGQWMRSCHTDVSHNNVHVLIVCMEVPADFMLRLIIIQSGYECECAYSLLHMISKSARISLDTWLAAANARRRDESKLRVTRCDVIDTLAVRSAR